MKKQRTRGGEFLIAKTDFNHVFTTHDFSEEQIMMLQTTKEFMEREVDPYRERFEKKDFAFIEEIMKKIGEMGLLGVSVPEKYGGLGMDFISTILICDCVSGCSGSLSTAFGAHTGIGTLPILLYGSEEVKQKFLPKLATGEAFGCYCLTEPGAGSDANSGKTKAVLSEDGTHYAISGQKMWISNAGFAEVFIVFARIEDDKNITCFVLDYDKENPNGITLGEEEHKLGIRSSSTRQVFFNETKIPVNHILGERGIGFKIAVNTLNVGRIKLAVACLDSQRRVITRSLQYAKERVQFKQSISEFGAIQQKFAEMATQCFASEAGCYRVAKDIELAVKERLDAGLSHAEAKLKGVEEYAVECSIMKVYASECMQNCADEGIQIYGGMGFSEETPMESAWRDSRISRIYEGTNEINRLLIVGMLIKRAMKGRLGLMEFAMKVSEELLGIPSFETPSFDELLSEEATMIEKLKKVVLMIAGKAVQFFGEKLSDQQQILTNISNIIIEVYLAESAILVAQKTAKKKGQDNVQPQIAMAKLNAFHALGKAKTEAMEAIVSFTSGDEQRIMLMGLKRYAKYQNYPNIVQLRKTISSKLIEEGKYCF